MRSWVSARRLLCVILLAPLALGMGVSEQEFLCENAAAHLEECCPSFSATPALCQQNAGCDGGEDLWLTVDESWCVQDMECGDLVASNVCERAATRMRLAEEGSAGTTRPVVCQ
ncbi:hypothetical protein WMF04_38770 [Sorangium sp. So ce260]|uniref:hypothetical protein n=1 Tax=Sorangium sp. So ce260 TaxID=3133291 RepID=UPI003F6432BB